MWRTALRRALIRGVIAVLATDASAYFANAAKLINSIADLSRAVRACWVAPPLEARSAISFSIRMSFRRNGELLGAPFVFFQTPNVSESERRTYRAAVDAALGRCTPLPFSAQFGSAMAGRPVTLHMIETSGRQLKI